MRNGIRTINLNGTVLADHVEEKLVQEYSRYGKRSDTLRSMGCDKVEDQVNRYIKSIRLDFSEASYIDIAALVNCIAIMAYRKRRNLITYVRYPNNKKVRDFLAAWRFIDAVEKATNNTSFREFLDFENDYEAIKSEIQTTFTGSGNLIDGLEYDPDWQKDSPSKRNFFEFSTVPNEPGNRIRPWGVFIALPRIESHRWGKNELVRQMLEKHLPSGTPKDEIARTIVQEAMSNTIRHPQATIIQTVSRFFPKSKYDKEQSSLKTKTSLADMKKIAGTLRICVWDDGQSIIDTLREIILAGKSVRIKERLPDHWYDSMCVVVRDFHEKVIREFDYNQGQDPDRDSPDYEILLSSLSPGITRTAEVSVPDVEHYDEYPASTLLPLYPFSPGQGLHALTRVALDMSGGNLLVRSGRYRLKLEKAPRSKKARYLCKITEYPTYYPKFLGNLLVIQLPTVDWDTT